MKQGAFLKENRKPKETKYCGQAPLMDRTERRRTRICRQKRQHLTYVVVIGVLLMAMVGMVFLLAGDQLTGTWYMDDVTAYQFNGRGKGALMLPDSEYEFTYEVEDDILYIDFVHEGAKDAEYVFRVNGDVLTMDGGNATTRGEYVLRRAEG